MACSTVANAKALLKSAIRSDNPVIFFEHVLLYNVKGAPPAPPPCPAPHLPPSLCRFPPLWALRVLSLLYAGCAAL